MVPAIESYPIIILGFVLNVLIGGGPPALRLESAFMIVAQPQKPAARIVGVTSPAIALSAF